MGYMHAGISTVAFIPIFAGLKIVDCHSHAEGTILKFSITTTFFPVGCFFGHWPIRDASEAFVAASRMETNLADLKIAVAVGQI